MGEMEFLGYLITAIITLGAFVGVVAKVMQPINELRVVIQKLNDNIDALKADNKTQSDKIEKHDNQINTLEHRVDKIETRVDLYHNS